MMEKENRMSTFVKKENGEVIQSTLLKAEMIKDMR